MRYKNLFIKPADGATSHCFGGVEGVANST